ncbi:MAG: oligosaccharide flippase family protein, partial [Candidatus Micrarchaeota archaeon]|nr:oligosaccharide flippase family protein [Candidatus Micrarchaeota archaeon]
MGEKRGGAGAQKASKASSSASASETERHELAHAMTRGTFLKFGSLGIVKALGLIYNIIILRMLPPAVAGLFQIVNNFVGIVSQFMSAGLPSAALRYAPLYSGRGEKEKLKRLVWTLSMVTVAMGIAVGAVLFAFSDAIAAAYGQPIGPVMPWVAILSLLFMLFNFWSNLLDALKQFGRSSALQAAQQLIRVVLTLAAFLWIGRTADIALGTYALTLLLPTVWLVWHFWGWLARLPGKLAFSWGVLFESMKFGIPAYISSTVDVLSTYIDVLMVGYFLGLEAAAAYSAIVIFVRNIAPFVTST